MQQDAELYKAKNEEMKEIQDRERNKRRDESLIKRENRLKERQLTTDEEKTKLKEIK